MSSDYSRKRKKRQEVIYMDGRLTMKTDSPSGQRPTQTGVWKPEK